MGNVHIPYHRHTVHGGAREFSVVVTNCSLDPLKIFTSLSAMALTLCSSLTISSDVFKPFNACQATSQQLGLSSMLN